MTQTTTVYASTDASAPVLNGTAGSMAALLDACLVNGYGSKPGAGWSIAYSGTNTRSYKTGRSGWNAYLYVGDTTATYASVAGYNNMGSASDAGTNRFPPAVSMVGTVVNAYFSKSTTADSTARPWVLIADQNTFYLFIETGALSASAIGPTAVGFGEFYSYRPSDTNNFFIAPCYGVANTYSSTMLHCEGYGVGSDGYRWLARNFSGQGPSIPYSQALHPCVGGTTLGIPSPAIVQPSPVDGTVSFSEVDIVEANQSNVTTNFLRGRLRGLWASGIALGAGETMSGAGVLAGRTFTGVASANKGINSAASQCVVTVETSSTWDTN